MVTTRELREAFSELLQARITHRASLEEVWEWNERLKGDTGGYRGSGDTNARKYERKKREELRAAFDTYISMRFGIPLPEIPDDAAAEAMKEHG
jgi:hypothetical protein